MSPQVTLLYRNHGTMLPIVALILALALFFPDTVFLITGEWLETGAYSHGLLAFPITIYLFWLDRSHFDVKRHFHWLAVAGFLLSTLTWIMANAANVFVLEVLALYGIFVACLGLLFGIHIWFVCYAAIGSLLLTLPVWNPLQLPLQLWAANVTQEALSIAGIPTFRDGFLFSVPGGNFYIEETCSGLGFFLSSCLLALVYTRVFQLSVKKAVLLLLAAVGISLVANWLRIVIIMIVGNETQMQHPIVTDHVTFGWFLFSGMLIPFIYIANRMVSTGSTTPAGEDFHHQPNIDARVVQRLLVILLLLAFGPVTFKLLEYRASHFSRGNEVFALVQAVIPKRADAAPGAWQPIFHGAHDIHVYQGHYNNYDLLALVVHYTSQDQGNELIFIENEMYDTGRWHLQTEIQSGEFTLLTLRDRSGRYRQILYTYFVAGQLTSNPLKAKLLELRGFLTGNTHAYLLAVASDRRSLSEDTDYLRKMSIELKTKLLE